LRTEAITPFAAEYMSIIFLGTFFYCFSASTNNVVRAEGNAQVAMISMVLGTGTNIILDPIFIFGFGWGIRGAAIATVIATALSFFYLTWYFTSGRSLLNIQLRDIRINVGILKEALSIGGSSLARMLAASLLGIFINNSLAFYGGENDLAILSIVYRLMIFATMPIIGIAQGLQPIIGFNYGAGKISRVKEALRKGVASSSIVSLAAFGAMMIFATFLLNLFTRDPALVQRGASILRAMCLFSPLWGFLIVAPTLFQALGKAGPALLLNVARQLLFLPLVLLMPLYLGIWGVWWAYPTADVLGLIVAVIWVAREIRTLHSPLEEKAAGPVDIYLEEGGVSK